MSKVVTIASGKGGAGKSTLSVSLGRALAARGKTVLLVEMDAGLRGLDLMLGVQQPSVYDLSDVLIDRCRPSQAVTALPGQSGLHLLSAAADPDFLPEEANFRVFFDLCRSCYDWILVDSPAGFGRGFVLSAGVCDLALVVVTPDPVSVRDCARAGQLLTRHGAGGKRLVINKTPNRLRGNIPDLDAVIDGVGIQLIGVIPQDAEMADAPAQGRDMAACPAKTAVENIAARLCGEPRELLVD